MNRNKKRGAHLDRRTIILIAVGAALAIIIIVAAILLMTRSGGGGKYEEHYSAAMEYYISGDFDSAVEEAQKAYDADATEDAAVLLARCYDQRGDSTSAIYVLETWLGKNSGSQAEALLASLKGEAEEEETMTIGGKEVTEDTETLVLTGVALSAEELDTLSKLTNLTALSLNDCGLTDASAVSGLTKLRSLSLNDNEIKDISPLRGLSDLRTLYLSGCGISRTEIGYLSSALPNCTIYA